MFNLDFYIDNFQATKRIVFEQIVADERLRSAANEYLNAQTHFAKMAVHNTIDIAKYSADAITQVWFPKKKETVAAPYKVESPAERAANTDTQGE